MPQVVKFEARSPLAATADAVPAAPAERLGSNGRFGEDLAPGQRSPAPYAASAIPSRGRIYMEADCPTRSPFQRDRDRIVHSAAFRRLTHKTQVFVYHEGDHYRTRLTHSLEVAQIARTIARQLRLDEDLAETIALAHDLGHAPFAHAGERALNSLMREHGGFDHNAQSFRAVTRLERTYAAFDGLNLTWETLEGLAKHNGPVMEVDAAVVRVARPIERWASLDLDRWASAEAQVAAISDDIAYVTHDIDDGVRAGLLQPDDLRAAPLAGEALRLVPMGSTHETSRLAHEITRRMIAALIADVVAASREHLRHLDPQGPEDIRGAGRGVIAFSLQIGREVQALKDFLFARVYRAPRVMRVVRDAEAVVRALFETYHRNPAGMPAPWRNIAELDARQTTRRIADFVAGMTDRYALAEHRRLFATTPDLR